MPSYHLTCQHNNPRLVSVVNFSHASAPCFDLSSPYNVCNAGSSPHFSSGWKQKLSTSQVNVNTFTHTPSHDIVPFFPTWLVIGCLDAPCHPSLPSIPEGYMPRVRQRDWCEVGAGPGDSDWSKYDWWLQLIHQLCFQLLLDLALLTL